MVAAATRILNGKNPVAIPIRLASKILVIVNRKNAEAGGLMIPKALFHRTDKPIDQSLNLPGLQRRNLGQLLINVVRQLM